MALNLTPPHEIRATYRIITPMFIGDAEQHATGISPQSVKGALRFWWRALQWGEIRKDAANDEDALCQLHEQEAKLFGIAMDEKRAAAGKANGQGKFTLRVIHPQFNTTAQNTVHSGFKANDAARYFGYGLMEAFGADKGTLVRSCINHDQTFELQLIFRDQIDDSIKNALIIMGLLGGLGSRVRRGIGSIALERLVHNYKEYQVSTTTYKDKTEELFSSPKDEADYISLIQKLLPNTSHIKQPPFSAFSMESRIDLLVRKNSAVATLNDLAKGMMMYRSWGNKGKVLSEDSEQNFPEDHDWFKKLNNDLPENFHPRRLVFGLPHNYHKKSHHVFPEPEDNKQKGEGRRASPVWFHVHRLSENNYLGIGIYLPATFLPANKRISANGRLVPQNIEWNLITDFLDGKYFRSKKVIFRGASE